MERLTDTLAVVSKLDPVSQGAGTVTSTSIDMAQYRRVMFILSVGAMTASSTVDMTIRGDTASGGTYTTAITGKTITQLTQAGSDSNKVVIVEVGADEVAAQGLRYIRASVVVGAAASLVSLVALAGDIRYTPASDFDLAAVDEIVA